MHVEFQKEVWSDGWDIVRLKIVFEDMGVREIAQWKDGRSSRMEP